MYVFAPNQTVEKFPYSIGDLRRDFPNTSFPRNPSDFKLSEWNVFPVVQQEPPSFNPASQSLEEANPVLVNGEWLQTWKVVNIDAKEIASRLEEKSKEIRTQRNYRLSLCDWTQLSDAPVDISEWAIYRQQLRDVPSQPGFPWEINWPEEP